MPMPNIGRTALYIAAEILQPNTVITFNYTNWKGEYSSNRRMMISEFVFGATEWHREPQFLLTGLDLDKNEIRAFAVKNMTNVRVG